MRATILLLLLGSMNDDQDFNRIRLESDFEEKEKSWQLRKESEMLGSVELAFVLRSVLMLSVYAYLWLVYSGIMRNLLG